MTQQPRQLKFGDRVRCKDNENPVFGVVLEEANPENGLITVQFIDDAEPELVGSEDLEYVPHPDTVRLNYLLFNEYVYLIGRYGKRYGIGRDEIDAAMRTQAAEAV